MTSRFVYKAIKDLKSIDHLFINPIRRIGLIHKCSLDLRWLKWIVQVNVLLNNCKQRITSLSLLVGTTIANNCSQKVKGVPSDCNESTQRKVKLLYSVIEI